MFTTKMNNSKNAKNIKSAGISLDKITRKIAILFAIGVILSVAIYWTTISNFYLVLIFSSCTFVFYYLGYKFKYEKKNSPETGAFIFFSGAFLFGITILLIYYIYRINANIQLFFLIWLIGILPLIYAFKSESVAVLSTFLYYILLGFIFNNNFNISTSLFVSLPIIFLSAGAFLFSFGRLHYFNPELAKIGRRLSISGIKISMLSLFLLTTKLFSEYINDSSIINLKPLSDLTYPTIIIIILFTCLSIIGIIINLIYNPSRAPTNSIENIIVLIVIGFIVYSILFTIEGSIYLTLINLLYIFLTLFIIYIGIKRLDIKAAGIGIRYISLFICIKYYVFFWELMPIGPFLLVGLLIIYLGIIVFRRIRKQIKMKILKQ